MAVAAAQAASAPAPATPATGLAAGATQACEQAVRDTLRNTRGAAADLSFNAPPAATPGAADGGDVLLRGAGRARSGGSTRTFTYSCNSTRAPKRRRRRPARRGARRRARSRAAPVRTVEPDLSDVSPAACESAAASALKRRWPNVGRIAFNAATRSLVQDSAGSAKLEARAPRSRSWARSGLALHLPVRARCAQRAGDSACVWWTEPPQLASPTTSIVPFIVGCSPQM